jgi:hypothetical protein
MSTPREVRRGDGELCGFVAEIDDGWAATTVFGGRLAVHGSVDAAVEHVLTAGLGSLAEHWTLVDRSTGQSQIVCIQEASPEGVTLALDYYSMPGVPTLRLTRDDLAGDRWQLDHGAP